MMRLALEPSSENLPISEVGESGGHGTFIVHTNCWRLPVPDDTKHTGRRLKMSLSCDGAKRLDYGGLRKDHGCICHRTIGVAARGRLLRGCGRFFDDLKLADQLHAAILRSPHAHADITGIDERAALQMGLSVERRTDE